MARDARPVTERAAHGIASSPVEHTSVAAATRVAEPKAFFSWHATCRSLACPSVHARSTPTPHLKHAPASQPGLQWCE
ncbi:hypothetical protein SNOG_07295 [Parastagonospora nodorum SN15]|uniref:Uncharacterized protein n=1 Tax=Phaeosphaeria nodorum (strain SN15 / ATCC MYA-4574 / FGSC 10173) TaxID=321614 RepID=Q0ULR9_PHANO|nr:hypothetical protein SNOG_07295 [Parastagonospora nodorum SN15]EAT84761.1 hypothetical protein SNOG_07295 [Parastagonospora nodorum SN15]